MLYDPRTEYAVKKHIQEYCAIITHLDQQIGEILDAVEASGNMDNTEIRDLIFKKNYSYAYLNYTRHFPIKIRRDIFNSSSQVFYI